MMKIVLFVYIEIRSNYFYTDIKQAMLIFNALRYVNTSNSALSYILHHHLTVEHIFNILFDILSSLQGEHSLFPP